MQGRQISVTHRRAWVKEKWTKYHRERIVFSFNVERLRKGKESLQFQALRNVVKEGCNEVLKNFWEKYRELRVEPIRMNTKEALYMGNQSNTRLQYQHKLWDIFREEIYFRNKEKEEILEVENTFRDTIREIWENPEICNGIWGRCQEQKAGLNPTAGFMVMNLWCRRRWSNYCCCLN